MKIHQDAYNGDLESVRQALKQLTDLETQDLEGGEATYGLTPIQCALSSPIASLDIVVLLFNQGAQLLFSPNNRHTALFLAIQSGRIEKIQWVLEQGADITQADEEGHDALITAMFSAAAINETDLTQLMQFLIDQGAPLNGETCCGESVLSEAARCGWFAIVQCLLRAGSDATMLGWTPLMHAVVLGTLSDMEALLETADLKAVDAWERTPWLLSLQVGHLDKAKRLLAAGSDPEVTGWYGTVPLMYAIASRNRALVAWLIEIGQDVNGTDDTGEPPLLSAVELDDVDIAQLLLAAGATLTYVSQGIRKSERHMIKKASSGAMVKLLVRAGASLQDVNQEVRCQLTQVDSSGFYSVSPQIYQIQKHPAFGATNPEEMSFPFWRDMVKLRYSAYGARHHYRDTETEEAGPVWSFNRDGQSITLLPDGRVIEIAGEHEDYYDPDFYIYNDVVVSDGDGEFTIYGYPRNVFPPTDFHTATLVDDQIYIIGNLGYPWDRVIDETPVYCLNCQTFVITKLVTSGQPPGWISNHQAMLTNNQIYVMGGNLWGQQGDHFEYVENDTEFVLDLKDLSWQALARDAM